MLSAWQLPRKAEFDGVGYDLHADYRDVLEIIGYLQNTQLPEFIRWQIALALFYEQQILPEHSRQAMEYLAWFLTGGSVQMERPGPKLLDWQQDAAAIISDVNKISGQEIRALPFLHWWTFLSWFHAIGEGQLSFLVGIRDKRSRGEKLTAAEQTFYRRNKDRVDLKKQYTPEEQAQRERLKRLLDGDYAIE